MYQLRNTRGANTPARRLTTSLRSVALVVGTIIGAGAILTAPTTNNGEAQAKTPGKTYCFLRTCHRVLTLSETRRRIGRSTRVLASFYRNCRVDRFNPCGLTSSGTVFRPNHSDNAASPIYPNGTKLLVWNPRNRRAAVVRIDNAGPYWGRRTLDLSHAAARKLGITGRGVARLTVQVIAAPTPAEARYRRRRVYAPVKGYMGRFKTLAAARQAATGRRSRPVYAKARSKRRLQLATATPPVLPVQKNVPAILRLAQDPTSQAPDLIATAMAPPAVQLPKPLQRGDQPSVRLPRQLARAELPAVWKRTLQKKRRLARLATKRRARIKRQTAAQTRARLRKRLKQTAKRKPAARKGKKTTAVKTAGVTKRTAATKPSQTNQARRATTPATRQRTASTKPATPPRTGAASPSTQRIRVAAVAPAVIRPKVTWRKKYFGVNGSGQ